MKSSRREEEPQKPNKNAQNVAVAGKEQGLPEMRLEGGILMTAIAA
jgi:hypothetical protein